MYCLKRSAAQVKNRFIYTVSLKWHITEFTLLFEFKFKKEGDTEEITILLFENITGNMKNFKVLHQKHC